ncbi:MAG TPA: Uma2 family endonuclease [Saprospiraceae bacterium]|nr:Uma2 family endonuclease [Saprospiraceae bacterium]HRK82020.1 Uma2 family endonuclease [Saprospiraceae bacterium]
MTATQKKTTYSVAEYLLLERRTGERYEFYNGKIRRMAGGTIAHNRITRNIIIKLGQLIDEKGNMEIFASDQKIYLPKYGWYVYPDAVVVAGVPIESEEEASAIINPILIFEVLSPSTMDYDRNRKFLEYQSLPSFQEYVLVRQDAPEALLAFREEPDLWRSSETAGMDADIVLRSIGASLPMKDVYAKVEF